MAYMKKIGYVFLILYKKGKQSVIVGGKQSGLVSLKLRHWLNLDNIVFKLPCISSVYYLGWVLWNINTETYLGKGSDTILLLYHKANLSFQNDIICVDVVSDVPQCTILDPLLFLHYMNDLPLVVSLKVILFADDCLIYRNIKNKQGHITLQKDLHLLENWGNT